MTPSRLSTLPGALSAAALLLPVLLAGCGGDDARSGGAPPWAMGRTAPVVQTEPVRQGSFTVDARFVGVLEATSAADLYARTSGQIVAVHADSGDRVTAGQVLARIEPDEAEKAVEQAQAALRIAEATLGQREANVEIARATARRTETLFEQDLVSQQDYDAAQADLVGARSQLELAEAQIEQAQANLSAARLELAKTRVIAPFDGWVGKRYLDLGDLAGTNRPVFSVVDLSTIETTISITEKDAGRIVRDQEATVRTEAYPDRVFEGRVARIASVFDPETNTTEAEVEVDNPTGMLKPGMFAEVAVTYRTEPTALLVPSSAVVETGGDQFVYLAVNPPAGGGEGAGGGTAGAGPRGAAGPGPAQAPGARRTGDGEAASQGPRWVARRIPVRVIGTGKERRDLSAVEVEGEGSLAPGAQVIVLGQEGLSDGTPVSLGDQLEPAGVRTGNAAGRDDTAREGSRS